MSGFRRRLAVSSVTLALLAALFALLELGVRALLPPLPDEQRERDWIVASLREQDACYRVTGFGPWKKLVDLAPPEPDRRNRTLPLARRPGVVRIALVGESNAWLLGNRLQALVDQSGCGERVEILNCGLPGSSMEPTERRFREVLDYRPDAVLLVFGHNIPYVFRREDLARLHLQALRSRSRLLTRITRALHGGFSAERETRALVEARGPSYDDAPLPPGAPEAERPRPGSPDSIGARRAYFRRMLHRMVAAASARHVPLVLSALASNRLKAPKTEPAELQEPALLEATWLHDTGRQAEAIQRLAAKPADRPWPHFVVGEWQLEAGDLDGARRSFEEAVDLDVTRPRATEEQNEFVRAVAREAGLLLHDQVKVLGLGAPHGVLGWETFADGAHFVPGVEVAEAIAYYQLALEAAKLPPEVCVLPSEDRGHMGEDLASRFMRYALRSLASASPDDEVRHHNLDMPGAIVRLFELGAPDVDERIRSVVGELEGSLALQRRAAALEALAEGYWRAGRPQPALAWNGAARRLEQGAGAWVQKGRFLLRSGRGDEARAAFEKARQLDGARADAAFFLARLDGERGPSAGEPAAPDRVGAGSGVHR